jgi:hypothetical protein
VAAVRAAFWIFFSTPRLGLLRVIVTAFSVLFCYKVTILCRI